MSLFANLAPVVTEPDGLRFVLGSIDRDLPGHEHLRADLFERGDGQWAWSARLDMPGSEDAPLMFDDDGGFVGYGVRTGAVVATEAQATEEALAWIRAQLGPTP